jgi:hypothetical protein
MTSRTTESAARIAGAGLLVLLAFGVLTRITNHSGALLQPPIRAVEIPTQAIPLDTETVDLTNGNIRLQIPIPATRKR